MMQRFVSSLLILLMVGSHTFCAAHSHAGTSFIEPEGHVERPHIHLHGGTHHDHHLHDERDGDDSHEESPSPAFEEEPVGNDTDAPYISETQLFNNAKPTMVAKVELSVACFALDGSATITGSRLTIGDRSPPRPRGLKCPRYLEPLSLLC